MTRRLLARYGIDTPLRSYHAHSAPGRLRELVARLDEADLALVSDAGTPGVSDPGAELVDAAARAGHGVLALPGPSAVAAALSVSGLPADRYHFLGFLPRRGKDRRALLRDCAGWPWSLVAFESPHRILNALDDIMVVLGDRRIAISRELTKVHEETWRGRVGGARAHMAAEGPRGEYTLVLEGAPALAPEPWSAERVGAALETLRAEGLGARKASRRVAEEAAWTARDVYRLWPHDAPDAAGAAGDSTGGDEDEDEDEGDG